MFSDNVASPRAAPVSGARVPCGAHAALAVAIGFAVSLALCWPRVADIWATGNFYDSDDAMRAVQVRDWIAGQGWFDLTAWRLDPPRGSFMHWSRVVDVPIAALIKLFSLFAPAETAERLARIVFPLSLQIALLAAVAWTSRILLGARGVAPALALAVLSGFMFVQFVPGRIDHHAPQIVLLMLMIGAMLAALDPGRARLAALAGACAALSLSISVENLPFIIVLFAAPPVAWMIAGAQARPLLVWFAGGLAISIALCFVMFNPPSRWLVPACDAFSYTHALVAFGAALVCGAMALARRWEAAAGSRVAFALAAGALAGLPLAFIFAPCLVDPFSGLDPLVRAIWLDNVGEARPALKHFALYPRSIQTVVIPALIGLAGMGAAIALERGLARARFALLLAFALSGCAGAAFMIRATTSLAPVALLGCAWIAARIMRRVEAGGLGGAGGLAIGVFAALPMSAMGWSLTPSLIAESEPPADTPASCFAAASYAPLAVLPPGLALAPIELGAHMLAHTPHSVITAPYHRNNIGNRLAIDMFMASPDAARAMIARSGARYIVACPGAKELSAIAARAPGSLAASLLKSPSIEGFRALDVAGTPLKVYAPD